MYPTLKSGDVLEIVPYERRGIKTGDIILFQLPELNDSIVHRVVHINSKGIITKGDNNNFVDKWVLTPRYIRGYVGSVKRKQKTFKVKNGFYGRITGKWRHIVKKYKSEIFELLRIPYYYLSDTGIFDKVILLINPRILTFKSGSSVKLQIMIGNFIVGRQIPGRNEWLIRRPFRLVFNDKYLKEIEQGKNKQNAD